MDAAPPPEPNPYEPPQAPTRRAAPPTSRPMLVIEVIAVAGLLVLACGVAFVATCVPIGAQVRGIYNRRTGTWVDWTPEAGGITVALGVALLLGRYWFGTTSPFRPGPRPPQS